MQGVVSCMASSIELVNEFCRGFLSLQDGIRSHLNGNRLCFVCTL